MATLPSKFVAKTTVGQFQVKITNRDYITIGSKEGCVQIAYSAKKNTAHLDWLGTEKGGCEVDGKVIKGADTVAMTDLGLTILRQLYPQVDPRLSLIDSSKFICNVPGEGQLSISNMIYSLLLTGKTYYQSRFNADLEYPASQPAFDAFTAARNNPEMFDPNYDFNNPDLNQALQPVLTGSQTWAEFFERLYHTYGRNTCTIMHAWYLKVYGFLTQNGGVHAHWIIDISRRPVIEYTITRINAHQTNHTRKAYSYNPYEIWSKGGYYPPALSYKKVLRKPKACGKSLKVF